MSRDNLNPIKRDDLDARNARRADRRFERFRKSADPVEWQGKSQRPAAMQRWLTAIIQDSSLSKRAIRLAVAYSHAFDSNGRGGCYKLDKTLCEASGLKAPTLREAKRELKDGRYLIQDEDERGRTVTFPSLPKAKGYDPSDDEDIPF
jgi:hypothetical protein